MMLRLSLIAATFWSCVAASSFAADERVETQMVPETRDFVILGGDGYGTSECLATASKCGNSVANAWCESKGFAKSVSYRLANKEETTASIRIAVIDQAFVITCSTK